MHAMTTTAFAKLAQFKSIRVVALVLDRCVIAFLAVAALQSDDRRAAFARGHVTASNTKET
jgi:hypothetical protein